MSTSRELDAVADRKLVHIRKFQRATDRNAVVDERIDTYRWHVAVTLVVMLAAVLRVSALSLMEFRHDSAYWAVEAWKMLHGGGFPLIGQQVGSVSVDLYNGPAMTWFTALIFRISGADPRHVAACIAVLNTAGVLLTYRLGMTLYSRSVGLLAATLMAVAPWVVLYSRMFWPQSLFPFLMPLSLLVLTRGIRTQRAGWLFVYGALLGIGIQLHLSTIAVAATGVFITLLYGRPRRLAISAEIAGIMLGYAPIILYDVQHNFINMRALLQLPTLHTAGEPRLTHFARTVWEFSNVLSGQGLWVSKIGNAPYMPQPLDWAVGVLLTTLFTVAFVMIAWSHLGSVRAWHLPRVPFEDATILCFAAIPFAYLLLSRSSVQRHYFIVLFPAAFLVIARGVELSWERFEETPLFTLVRSITLSAIGVACVLNLVTMSYAYRFVDDRGGEAEYGITLADKEHAVHSIIADADGSFSVVMTSVQEPLPYVFLLTKESGDRYPVDAVDAVVDLHTHTGSSHIEYLIVEAPYHDPQLQPGDDVIFRTRGVLVVKREVVP